jgi:hypothetical protein
LFIKLLKKEWSNSSSFGQKVVKIKVVCMLEGVSRLTHRQKKYLPYRLVVSKNQYNLKQKKKYD